MTVEKIDELKQREAVAYEAAAEIAKTLEDARIYYESLGGDFDADNVEDKIMKLARGRLT